MLLVLIICEALTAAVLDLQAPIGSQAARTTGSDFFKMSTHLLSASFSGMTTW